MNHLKGGLTMSRKRLWLRNALYVAIGISLLLSAGIYSHQDALAQTGEVSIHLHLDKTTVSVGEEIQATLSIANSIAEPPIQVRLILKVPPGMSVSSTEHLKAGAGQYIGTYEVDTGQLRHIGLALHPNQPGVFVVEGHLEWYFGEDRDKSQTKIQSFPVTVRSSVTPLDPSERSTTDIVPSWLWAIIIAALTLVLIASIVHGSRLGQPQRSRTRTISSLVTIALLVVIGLLTWQSATNSTTSEFSASVSPLGTGIVSPDSGTYTTGEVISLTATPMAGYRFVHWTGDTRTVADVEAASTSIRLKENVFVVANFVRIDESAPPSQPVVQHNLAVSSSSGGSVTTPGEGTFKHEAGAMVSLVATPDSGYRFVNWTGNVGAIDDVQAATTSIRLDGDAFIVANFMKNDESTPPPQPLMQHHLTVSSTAGGSVSTPGEGTFEYDAGTVVTLVATPTSCYEFANWTGEVGTIANVKAGSTTIRLDRNYSISANFVKVCEPEPPPPPPSPSYDISISSNSGGSVTTPGEGVFEYDNGTVVTIVATPASGYEFVRWTGDVGTVADVYAASTIIRLDRSYSISANFRQKDGVHFDDPNLEAVVREAIGIADGPVYASDLRGLTSLVAVDKSITSLAGLEYCLDMVSLDLRNNHISNLTPLASLTQLTRLMLWDNRISDISPLANLKKLAVLHLMWNNISDITPLAPLTALGELCVGANQIGDISPLAHLTNLTRLGLVGNQISDISPLANLSNLTMLSISGNRISDISVLGNLMNLTQVNLTQNQISDITPLASLAKLELLWLLGNRISDISPLANLTQLWVLDLGDNQISDVSPLLDNAGLGEGDELVLTGNPLSSDSLNTYIPQLETRGVSVSY